MDKNLIQDILKKNHEQISSLGVYRLGLFGSFVRNEQYPNSDIDLLVEFVKGKKNFDNFIGLSQFLEEIFNRPVDLLTASSLSPYIGSRILQEVSYVSFSNCLS